MNKKIAKNINWVGCIDWNVREFHGYETSKGTTYNAYLIKGEKNVLVDTVKFEFTADFIKNIEEIVPTQKLDFVICNHAEPDHSAALAEVMKIAPQATLLCNQKCADILKNYYDCKNWKIQIVSDGETIKIGEFNYTFAFTPMAHWPESMVTYFHEEQVLFSMDAFGQHFASSERFDDENCLAEIEYEAKKYYANIILPYGSQVNRAIEKLSTLDIKIIAPSHGVIWRKDLARIIELYKSWANHQAKNKVVIFYDTMWKSTDKMAKALYDGANSVGGIEVKLLDVKFSHVTELITQLIDCAAFAVGTPTLNGGMMPKIAEAMCYIKGLAPQNKLMFAFGSYGWAKKGGADEVQAICANMKGTLLTETPIISQFKPTDEILKELFEKGVILGNKAKEFAKK